MGYSNLPISALKALAQNLGRASFRKAFDQDPLRTLERAGIDLSALPKEQIDLLAELSLSELEVLGRLQSKLGDAQNMARDTNGGIFF